MSSGSELKREKKPLAGRNDWYSLSIDSVRAVTIVFLIIGLGVVGLLGYRYTQHLSLDRKASIVINEAEFLLSRVQTESGAGVSSGTYNEAWTNLQDARRQHSAGEFNESLVSARWSRNLLSSLLDDLRNQAPSGQAQFVSVQGGVEFRRGDGPWQVARNRLVLRSGDYVKTAGSGSAEVSFSDGTNFRVRPDTVILINQDRGDSGAANEETVSLEYGWINLDTTESPSRVRTPEAVAQVAEGSRAEVSFDRSRRMARFSSFQGSMEVRTKVGTVRRLGAMEQLVHSAAGLSAAVKLPSAPSLLAPDADASFELADDRMLLRWQRVEGATRYGLQICRDDHFVDNVIDVENRNSTVATVGILGTGRFLWRVAAFSRQGAKGPWSEPQSFVVGDTSTNALTERVRSVTSG
jgi:hypothetical protein